MKNFKGEFRKYFDDFLKVVETQKGDWTVKGFIDIYKNIYTISVDTKVVSKIIELLIFPVISKFSLDNNYRMILSSHQNHYPDITFIDEKTKEKIALDLKSTYRINNETVNGMTLGAFTGYFRNRKSNKNITFPYREYDNHFILGVIYSKTELSNAVEFLISNGYTINDSQRKLLFKYLSTKEENVLHNLIRKLDLKNDSSDEVFLKFKNGLQKCMIDERKHFKLTDLKNILSVIKDFEFFIQEKWRVAIDRPGSGNTKNIGSTNKISELNNGKGLFTKYRSGKKLFDNYWMNYQTKDMAYAEDLEEPLYSNIHKYFEYKGINEKNVLTKNN